MMASDSVVLVIVDVQGKLATLVHDHEALFDNIERMVLAADALAFPVLPVEQIPEKLGRTVPKILQHLVDPIISKTTFSAMKNSDFEAALSETGRKHVLLTGIESHICVYQTAKDLISKGYEVTMIADAVSSRAVKNKELAIENLRSLGVHMSTVEMALFEMMEDANHPAFKQIQRIVK